MKIEFTKTIGASLIAALTITGANVATAALPTFDTNGEMTSTTNTTAAASDVIILAQAAGGNGGSSGGGTGGGGIGFSDGQFFTDFPILMNKKKKSKASAFPGSTNYPRQQLKHGDCPSKTKSSRYKCIQG